MCVFNNFFLLTSTFQSFYLIFLSFPFLRQAKKYVWLALLGLLAVHAVKTHVRNGDWRDEYTIFTAGLKVGVSGRRLRLAM